MAKTAVLQAGYHDGDLIAKIDLNSDVWDFHADGREHLRVVWTDPPGEPPSDEEMAEIAEMYGFAYDPS